MYPNVGDHGINCDNWGCESVSPEAQLTRGVWHRIEVVVVANTGGALNGQFHLWVNGVKTAEHNDVWYINEGEPGFHGIEWTPVWGGQGDRLLQEQYMWVDGFYVSGSS